MDGLKHNPQPREGDANSDPTEGGSEEEEKRLFLRPRGQEGRVCKVLGGPLLPGVVDWERGKNGGRLLLLHDSSVFVVRDGGVGAGVGGASLRILFLYGVYL